MISHSGTFCQAGRFANCHREQGIRYAGDLTKKRAAAGLSRIYGPKAVESGLSQAKSNISFLEGRVGDPTEAISEAFFLYTIGIASSLGLASRR